MEHIQPYLDYFAQHPSWALLIVFLISMGEALLVIGLFVPSTAVLVGAGTLVGAGKLDFWPVMIATTLGCIVGDQVSFWAGRFFGDRLRTMWPLKNYPHLLAKGEAYVKEHGGKSIAIGRFVPGVKAVVPGIAGMFGMGQGFFLTVNILSGIAWSAGHLLPGVVLGHALSLAGALSGRLLVVLLVLLGVLAVAGWLVRLLAAGATPYRKAMQGRISAWALSKQNIYMRRLGRTIAPENPNSVLLLLSITIGVVAVIALIDLVSGLLLRQAVGNFDHSLFNFFSELRSVPGDEIFVRITMLGDNYVLYAMALVPVIWMLVLRNWRGAIAVIFTVVLARLVLIAFSFGVSVPASAVPHVDFRFPSGHALMAGTVLGIIATLTARGLQRWTQALIVSGCTMVVFAISFSRLYLGVNWLSDVVGGILIASILTVLFSVAVASLNLRRFHPLAMLFTSVLVLLVAGGIDIQGNFERRVERYQPIDKITAYSLADYLETGWTRMPGQRINLIGKPSDVFVAQWVGSVASLRDVLSKDGFEIWQRWGWRDAMPYLSPESDLASLSPNPAIHEGLRAKITATAPDPANPASRFVLRAFQSNATVQWDSGASRVYLINITRETVRHDLGLFAVPADKPVKGEDVSQLIQKLTQDSGVDLLSSSISSGQGVAILRPKS